MHRPIDDFLRSLAQDQGSRAIGVILSGTASDGVLGLQAIKAEGGVTFAQEVATAKYAGMPESAIAAGHVDFVLSPEKIARQLARLAHHPFVTAPPAAREAELPQEEGVFNQILLLLKAATGLDFTHYKHSTIKRRINRRMMLQQVEKLEDYVRLLRENAEEVKSLYEDILINVTSFFREPEAFEALQQVVFPEIMRNRAEDEAIRIWVPGCASGEEAYSLAISLLEFLGDLAANVQIQIFATDIEDGVIDKARQGIYPEAITADVSPERLRRFFVKVPGGYQVSKTIRGMCVFARQNLIKDPPFSRMDLISCRNVLIYFGPVLQKKVIPIFHFALKPTGFLLLGKSEALSAYPELFTLVDKKLKIFLKKAVAPPHLVLISDRRIYPGSRGARQDGPDRGGSRCSGGPAGGSGPHDPGPLRPGRGGHRRRPEHHPLPGAYRPLSGTGAGRGQPQSHQDGPGRAASRTAGRGVRRPEEQHPGAQRGIESAPQRQDRRRQPGGLSPAAGGRPGTLFPGDL